MPHRYLLDFFAILFIVFAPWWIAALALVSGVFLFNAYYELFLFSLLYDLLFAVGTGVPALTFLGAFTFVLFQLFRYNFNLHEKKVGRHTIKVYR